LQDTSLAVQGFQKTIELNPDDLDAMKQLGLIYIDGGTYIDYTKALDYYQRANAIEPHSYNTVRGIGKALVKLGRAEEAAPYLEEAAQLYEQLKR
jgi:tetratricopeptide (TPR) repeat protein